MLSQIHNAKSALAKPTLQSIIANLLPKAVLWILHLSPYTLFLHFPSLDYKWRAIERQVFFTTLQQHLWFAQISGKGFVSPLGEVEAAMCCSFWGRDRRLKAYSARKAALLVGQDQAMSNVTGR
jgi:hypothetical protein